MIGTGRERNGRRASGRPSPRHRSEADAGSVLPIQHVSSLRVSNGHNCIVTLVTVTLVTCDTCCGLKRLKTVPGACGGSAPRPCAPDGDPSPLRRGAVLQTSPLRCRALRSSPRSYSGPSAAGLMPSTVRIRRPLPRSSRALPHRPIVSTPRAGRTSPSGWVTGACSSREV